MNPFNRPMQQQQMAMRFPVPRAQNPTGRPNFPPRPFAMPGAGGMRPPAPGFRPPPPPPPPPLPRFPSPAPPMRPFPAAPASANYPGARPTPPPPPPPPPPSWPSSSAPLPPPNPWTTSPYGSARPPSAAPPPYAPPPQQRPQRPPIRPSRSQFRRRADEFFSDLPAAQRLLADLDTLDPPPPSDPVSVASLVLLRQLIDQVLMFYQTGARVEGELDEVEYGGGPIYDAYSYSDMTSDRSGSPAGYDPDESSYGSPYDDDGYGYMTPPIPRARRPGPAFRGRRARPYYDDSEYFYDDDAEYIDDAEDRYYSYQRGRARGPVRRYVQDDQLNPRGGLLFRPQVGRARRRREEIDEGDYGISSLYDEGDESELPSSSQAQSEDDSVARSPSPSLGRNQPYGPRHRSLKFKVKDKSRWALDPKESREYDFNNGGLVVRTQMDDDKPEDGALRPASVSFSYRPFQPRR